MNQTLLAEILNQNRKRGQDELKEGMKEDLLILIQIIRQVHLLKGQSDIVGVVRQVGAHNGKVPILPLLLPDLLLDLLPGECQLIPKIGRPSQTNLGLLISGSIFSFGLFLFGRIDLALWTKEIGLQVGQHGRSGKTVLLPAIDRLLDPAVRFPGQTQEVLPHRLGHGEELIVQVPAADPFSGVHGHRHEDRRGQPHHLGQDLLLNGGKAREPVESDHRAPDHGGPIHDLNQTVQDLLRRDIAALDRLSKGPVNHGQILRFPAKGASHICQFRQIRELLWTDPVLGHFGQQGFDLVNITGPSNISP